MIALAAGQFPFNAADFAAFGALFLAACVHCAFLAASSQREKLLAAPEMLLPFAAAMHASQAFAPVSGAAIGGFALGLNPPALAPPAAVATAPVPAPPFGTGF